MVASLDRLLPF